MIWGGIALAFVIALVAIFWPKTSGPLDNVARDVFLVRQETVQKRDLKHELLMSGSIKALEEATQFICSSYTATLTLWVPASKPR